MGLRRKSRELALQFLFSCDFLGQVDSPEEVKDQLEQFCQLFAVEKRAVPYGQELISGIRAHRDAIDVLLAEHSHNWRVERMSLVDRNILRIAIFELCYGNDAPVQVVINEALEIAKRYSVDESIPFINGILDAVQSSLRR